ncbi:MAG: ATP-binding protein [Candidatus Nitrosocaldus sp.]
MNSVNNEIGVILSKATTKMSKCQLLETSEKAIHEGMLVKIIHDKEEILANIVDITTYNEFYTEGDAWSESRRKQYPIPSDVARQYVICELEHIGKLPGITEVTSPPSAGDKVYKVDLQNDRNSIFGNDIDSRGGIVWFGSLFGYNMPVPLEVENIFMHMAIFGTTGSGKSYTTGALIEKLTKISLNDKKGYFSLPILIIDANGDYLDYVEYIQQSTNKKLGVCEEIIRYVFPKSAAAPHIASKTIKPFSIDLNALSRRELAEMIVYYYSGGELNELQVNGIERIIQQMEEMADIKENMYHDIFTQRDLFNIALERLNELKAANQIHSQTAPAIERALKKFREIDDSYGLFSAINKLDEQFIDGLTTRRKIAIIDFSADGATGIPLQLKQLVVSYLSTILYNKFTEYKRTKKNRYMLLIIEECQNYIPNLQTYNVNYSLAREKLSLIATQGRKFGLALCLISQRPAFVDPVVLSMCNTFFIHRISPDDQIFVERACGGLPSHLKKRLTTLERGVVIVTGQMTNRLPFPLLLRIPKREVSHTAGSISMLKYMEEQMYDT